jgi:hypothetical protein
VGRRGADGRRRRPRESAGLGCGVRGQRQLARPGPAAPPAVLRRRGAPERQAIVDGAPPGRGGRRQRRLRRPAPLHLGEGDRPAPPPGPGARDPVGPAHHAAPGDGGGGVLAVLAVAAAGGGRAVLRPPLGTGAGPRRPGGGRPERSRAVAAAPGPGPPDRRGGQGGRLVRGRGPAAPSPLRADRRAHEPQLPDGVRAGGHAALLPVPRRRGRVAVPRRPRRLRRRLVRPGAVRAQCRRAGQGAAQAPGPHRPGGRVRRRADRRATAAGRGHPGHRSGALPPWRQPR